ncbi:prolyl 4-hydroxylase subunit alpha-1-like [Stegastes partitus]|uniref:procollagen-proline 4-dioxygenase n=1 Tax=Stegastes partitus TaxID=144197 RepID=A0A9Y4NHF4_9TELE|nr:PREDICTED: prolyl 4-hydroxylase subunit alpha-1-like [Stegastes partitus]
MLVSRWADRLDVLSSAATQDPEGFLGHPVNAFKLMKRLNTEWAELESLVLTDMTDVFISNLTIQRQNFPNDDDQTGAAKALMRLQDTYQLDTNTISTGQLPGSSSATSLTVDDCYDLGKVAYSEADYYHTELWMVQALKQLDQGETSSSVDAVAVLDYLSYSVYQQGALETALDFTKRLLELGQCRRIFKFLEQLFVVFCELFLWCQSAHIPNYLSLRRATISNPVTGVLETAHYRISKSAWLGAYEHPVVDKINQRIEDITGLDVSTAEDLQVANYGVGGQYEPHFDFGRKDEPDAFEELGTGNRIATWLLYMSDVQAGGATVFTDVGAAVWPKKGTAVFWYNLYPSGEGDYRTRHAACPVLVGNKWVSNKWIHERGQEFRRRCGLQETD